MSLKQKLQEDMKSSLKSGEKKVLNAIRYLLAQVKNAEIDKGSELTDEEILRLISREIKKLEEAAEEFKAGGNEERAREELEEAEILKRYLPEPLSEEEIEALVDEAIKATKATSIRDMGRVMKEVLPKTAGRADGKLVSEIVKKKLS